MRPSVRSSSLDAPAPLRFVSELASHGDRTALMTPGGRVSYVELAGLVSDLVSERRRAHGRWMATISLEPTLDSVVDYLSALGADQSVLVVPPDRKGDELAERYSGAGPVHPDMALALSTSGSTGSPKLVRLSHENVQSNADAIAQSLGLGADDVGITSLPLHYTYGLSVLHSHLAVGAAVVLTDLSVVDECFWRLVEQHGVTSLAAVPFTIELLDRSGFVDRTVPSLRRITQAGGRLDPDDVARYARLGVRRGWDFVVMYGQTEATARMAVLPPDLAETHPTSVGRPIPGGHVRLEPAGHPDPSVGELVYSGPNVMLGYAECVEDLARGRDTDELRTGDLARIDDAGMIEIVGRLGRMIKPFGTRIDLSHLEDALKERGHRVLAAGDDSGVVLGVLDGGPPAVVHAACTEVTGLPAAAVVAVGLPEVPRLSNGKVDTGAVLALRPTDDSPPCRPDVQAVFAAVLARQHVRPTDTFVSLGGDSLSYVEVSIRLEAVLGRVPDGWHLATVEDLERSATSAGRTGRVRRGAQMDTTVLLRAVAICLVVGHHTGTSGFRGGAHTMLVLAGYNLARFRLNMFGDDVRQRYMWRSIAAIAVPSVVWIALQSVYWDHGWKNMVLLHNYLGARPMGPEWRYWYIEVIVQTLVVVAVLMSCRRVREFEQTHRYGVAAAVLAATLFSRYVIGSPKGYYAIFTTHTVIWMFALGWLVERSTTTRQRIVVSVIAVATIPGFFGEWSRELVIVVGTLALIWLPIVRVPRMIVRPLGVVAASSLAIYLTHWQVYHPLTPQVPAPLVAALCVVVGVLVWMSAQRAVRFAGQFMRRSGTPANRQSSPAYIDSISVA